MLKVNGVTLIRREIPGFALLLSFPLNTIKTLAYKQSSYGNYFWTEILTAELCHELFTKH